MRKVSLLLIVPWLLLSAACDRAPEPTASAEPTTAAPSPSQRPPWADFRDEFITDYFEHSPDAAILLGRHEYDGRLHDLSPAAVAEEVAWLEAERATALDYTGGELAGDAAFERDYLIAAIDLMLFNLEVSGFLENNVVFYAAQVDPSIYLTLEYAPLATRMAAFATYAENLPAFLERMQANLRPPLARPHVEVSRGILDGLATFFADTVPGVFTDVDEAALEARFTTALATATDALEQSLAWLDAQELDDDYALGAERFLTMLRMSEGVDITLAELKAAGRADLDRNLAELREACNTYAPGDSLTACVDRTKAFKMEGGPVEGARGQLAGLKQFVIDADLVSIPGTEEALVDEAPPYRRFNSAYINIPGPYDAGLPSTYYIAPPDPAWSEADRLAYVPARKDLLYISVHEVWPGHFLQFLHAKRAESPLGRLFQTYSMVEGWAHYAEQLVLDAGLDAGDAESQIGQLSNALLRNVRYLSAIGLHTEGMTVDESRIMFEEVGLQDPGNARQQADRGTYDPGYLNYTLGKLMIMKLRDDWTASRGGRDAWKEFHDTFLSYGSPPIPLIRAHMLGADYAGDTALLPP